MSSLSVVGLRKRFDDKVVLDAFDLEVSDGEFISLLGPSGCGKTTTLNIVAGFLEPDVGGVLIDGEDVTGRPANRRNTALVFQNYALFPHMTVTGNVGYGLRFRSVSAEDRVRRVAECLDLMGISELADRYPSQLSGGQQQRVAVARALSVRPGLLLMDEPLSNLDARLRADIRTELRAIQQELGLTVVFVTHDQEEALTMSDRIVLMNNGRVEQIGTPEDVYSGPETVFVADFLGVRNIFSGAGDGKVWRSEDGIQFSVAHTTPFLGVRPSQVNIATTSEPVPEHASRIEGRVATLAYQGDTVSYEVVSPSGVLLRAVLPAVASRADLHQDVTAWIDPVSVIPLHESVGGSPS